MNLINGDSLVELKKLDDNSLDSLVTDPPAGIAFMGKDWDKNKGGRDQWIDWLTQVMKECHRTMKPGAHGLVWAIPRTSHWTATALENAGFEIRDVVAHLFGTGFPKSLDISKAIDKAAGAEREVVEHRFKNGDMRGNQCHANNKQAGKKVECNITSPSTVAAKQWNGFGTALKPSSEHWILIRKPISEKNIAANVLKWGVGGLNIDGCRVETTYNLNGGTYGGRTRNSGLNSWGKGEGGGIIKNGIGEYKQPPGRFPANTVFSHHPDCHELEPGKMQCCIECAVGMLDRQSGVSKSSGGGKFKNSIFAGGKEVKAGLNDSGGASRFFYCAKASKSDRGEGNTHPTVKSTKLMEYLIKLVTPPGGTVLDPFMGSGSTGVAAIRTGFDFVGIELEQASHSIASNRLSTHA